MTTRYICDRCGSDHAIYMRSIETAPLPDECYPYGDPDPIVGHLCGPCHALLHAFMEDEL